MQIFVLDHAPDSAAAMLCDVHLRKMCLETAQILSALLLARSHPLHPAMPRLPNRKHPVILAVNTPFKVNWLVNYNLFLHREYLFRFDKTHAYYQLADEYFALLAQICWRRTAPADLTFCCRFKAFTAQTADVVQAYRAYYRYKKTIIRNFNYTRRPPPEWLEQ